MLERFGVPRCCCGPTCACFDFRAPVTFTLTITDRVAGARVNFYTSVQFTVPAITDCSFIGKPACVVSGSQINPIYTNCIGVTDWFTDSFGVPRRMWLGGMILNCNPFGVGCPKYTCRMWLSDTPTGQDRWNSPSDPFNAAQPGCTFDPLLLQFGPWRFNILQPNVWGPWFWMYPQAGTFTVTVSN